MPYIYSITNNINKKQYVGKTSKDNPYDRWKEHIQHAKHKDNTIGYASVHSMPIIRALRKHGSDNFKFRVITECSEDKVNELEEHYIKEYNTYGKNGYNATFGGDGIRKDPEQWSNHPNSKPVTCYSLDGRYICDYDTAGIALVETLGHNPNRSERSALKACCKGIVFQSHNYRWTWKGEPLKEWKDKQIRLRYKVYGYHSITGEYKEWASQADCSEDIEGNRKNNANVKLSLDSPRTAKIHCKKWWLFRMDGSRKVGYNHIKVTPRNRGTEYYKKLAALSKKKRARPVRAVSKGLDNEVLYFESLVDASYFIKGKGNRSGVPNIINNINRPAWCQAYGYKWSYQ